MNIKLILVVLLFILGLYFVTRYPTIESFDIRTPPRCPTLLLQKGTDFYLYNSNTAKIPGVNPLKFNSLEEYVEFTKWQRSQGIICPILYLQEVYDTQGNPVYKARPSPTDMQGGLPDLMPSEVNPQESKLIDATRDKSSTFNKNSYPAFDAHNLYIGLETPLDKMFHETTKISSNPMDGNWGGNKYTSSLINAGYYGKDS